MNQNQCFNTIDVPSLKELNEAFCRIVSEFSVCPAYYTKANYLNAIDTIGSALSYLYSREDLADVKCVPVGLGAPTTYLDILNIIQDKNLPVGINSDNISYLYKGHSDSEKKYYFIGIITSNSGIYLDERSVDLYSNWQQSNIYNIQPLITLTNKLDVSLVNKAENTDNKITDLTNNPNDPSNEKYASALAIYNEIHKRILIVDFLVTPIAEEIKAALTDNKLVICRLISGTTTNYYLLTYVDGHNYKFTSINDLKSSWVNLYHTSTEERWEEGNSDFLVKKLVIDFNNPTDDTYPSTKAVKTELDKKINISEKVWEVVSADPRVITSGGVYNALYNGVNNSGTEFFENNLSTIEVTSKRGILAGVVKNAVDNLLDLINLLSTNLTSALTRITELENALTMAQQL